MSRMNWSKAASFWNSTTRIPFVLGVIGSVIQSAVVGNAAITLPEITAALERNSTAIQSAEATFTVRSSKGEGGKLMGARTPLSKEVRVQQIEWAVKGAREYRKSIEKSPQASRKVEPEVVVFDGKETYNLELSAEGTVVRANKEERRRSNPIVPLRFGYRVSGHQWIIEDLRAAHYQLVGTERSLQFGTLAVLSGRKEDGRERRYWIAPERGYLAVRVLDMADPKQDSLEIRYECLAAEPRNALWFPVQGISEAYYVRGGKKSLVDRSEIEVSRWAVNTVPDQRFAIQLPPNTEVWDADQRTIARVASNGQQLAVEKIPAPGSGRGAMRLLFLVSATAVLILSLVGLLRSRRRSRPVADG